MPCSIVNGRIDGTRITVWDVFMYVDEGCSTEEILDELPLTAAQLQATLDFIQANREYVVEGHRKIEERNARGNPPEIQARLVQTRAKMRARLEQRHKERAGAGTPR